MKLTKAALAVAAIVGSVAASAQTANVTAILLGIMVGGTLWIISDLGQRMMY